MPTSALFSDAVPHADVLSEWQYDRIVADIHATALDPGKWDSLLRRFADRLGASSALFGIRDIPRKQWTTLSLAANDDQEFARMRAYDWEVLRGMQVGAWEAFPDAESKSGAALLAARIYEDAGHYGVMAFRFAANGLQLAEPLGAILARLSPHLELASRMLSEVARLKLQAAVACLALDRLVRPLWVVEPDGMIHYCNDAALQLAGKHGISMMDSRLVLTVPACRDQFRHLLQQSSGPDAHSEGMSLGEQEGAIKLMFFPLPSDSPLSGSLHKRLVLVMAIAPDSGEALPLELLSALYGLSPAETRLASRLLEGETLAEAATCLGIRVSTARTQLKFIFWKTGVRRQSELIKLLASATPLRA
ncbi:helix-turn-helix transcriptional regulator [Burkholderiaceae bacterium DAT-1]|nr:helix-turn-helix transcriptional regulator [Burkholderiaceae bacterium DAT-1]